MKDKRREFTNMTDGVELYVWIQQFNRISKKIEGLHEKIENLEAPDGLHYEEIQEALKYYKYQKSIILSKLYDCMLNTKPIFKDNPVTPPKPEDKKIYRPNDISFVAETKDVSITHINDLKKPEDK